MRLRRRKCPCCRQWFLPQPHNAYHQRYCTEPRCRRASKRRSQRRWLGKNPDQNRGPANVLTVRAWRAEHPGPRPRLGPIEHLRADLFMFGAALKRVRLRVEHLNSGAEECALFPARGGGRVPYQSFRRRLHRYAAQAGLQVAVTPHTFRRSCATELLRAGANMYQVKEILDRESLDIFRHYARLTIADLQKTHAQCHPRERENRG